VNSQMKLAKLPHTTLWIIRLSGQHRRIKPPRGYLIKFESRNTKVLLNIGASVVFNSIQVKQFTGRVQEILIVVATQGFSRVVHEFLR
jgi:hypothetical protein